METRIFDAPAEYDRETNEIILSPKLVALLNSNKPEERALAEITIGLVILHETVHWGRDQEIDPTNRNWQSPEVDRFQREITERDGEDIIKEANSYGEYYDVNVDPFEAGNFFEIKATGVPLASTEKGAQPPTAFDAKKYIENAKKASQRLNSNDDKKTDE